MMDEKNLNCPPEGEQTKAADAKDQPSAETEAKKFDTENSTIFAKRVYKDKKKVKRGELKRILTVVTACVLCIVIGLSALLVVKLLPEEETTLPPNSNIEINSIPVLSYDDLVKSSTVTIDGKEQTVASNIKSFSMNNYYESFSFSPYYVKNESASSSSSQTSSQSSPAYSVNWQLNGIDKELTRSATIAAHIKRCLNITALQEMPNTYSTLEEYYKVYGLSSEDATRGVVVQFNDGTEDMVILVGSQVPTGDGNYVTVSGNEKVYVVSDSIIQYFDWLPVDFAEKTMIEKMTETSENKKYFNDSGELAYYDYIKLSGEIVGNRNIKFVISDSPSAEFMPYWMSVPYNRPANNTFISELISFASGGLSADTLLTYKATQKNIEACQLDKPKCVIEYKAGGYKFKLIVGGIIQEEGTKLPVMIEGKPQIFYIDKESFDFIPTNIKQMFGTDVVLENIYTLKALEFTDAQGTYRFDITHTPVKGETDVFDTAVTSNGVEYDSLSFKYLYERVLGLSLLDFKTEAQKTEVLLKVQFIHKNYDKNTVLEVTASPDDMYHYLVWVDGKVYGEVLKSTVDDALHYLHVYLDGGEVPPTKI